MPVINVVPSYKNAYQIVRISILIIGIYRLEYAANYALLEVTYRPAGPGALYLYVYYIMFNMYIHVCTCHYNKEFTYLLTYLQSCALLN